MKMNMKMLAVICLLVAPVASADLLIIQNQGVTPVPVDEKRISMDYESVEIDASGNVKALFLLRSHDEKPIERKVAFPIVNPDYAHAMQQDFKVESRTKGDKEKFKAIPTALEMKPVEDKWAASFYATHPEDVSDYPGFVTWKLSWEPGETKEVVCAYNMGSRTSFRGIVDGWQVSYVVRTGALWKGPIGKADIRIRFDTDVRSHRTSSTPLVTTYPNIAKWVSGKEVTWHFENWEPDKDIQVTSYGWVGLTEDTLKRYFVPLPYPYRGDKVRYTGKTLDQIVEKQLAPLRPVFPRRVRKLDRTVLRKLAAEWLLHEILARHGDPFILSKDDGADKWPKQAVSKSQGYYFSRWSSFFQGYGLHGGWYRPRPVEKGPVTDAELSPNERKNARFLRRVVGP